MGTLPVKKNAYVTMEVNVGMCTEVILCIDLFFKRTLVPRSLWQGLGEMFSTKRTLTALKHYSILEKDEGKQ